MNNDFNKVQINENIEKMADGKIIKSSLMINIRADSVKEATDLFKELKEKLNASTDSLDVAKPKPKEEGPICDCGAEMILRHNGKKNSFFWGCPHYPECRNTVPYKSSLPVIQVD
ncbi:MAG: topoisomerase DNA-binding C4 zinc finger domain-containing protein [Patescibacteria group bacterium]|nr:topoisomerase DNA-binding C4 zinc finger domain-containing protein [Patescibacteria group bacterium]